MLLMLRLCINAHYFKRLANMIFDFGLPVTGSCAQSANGSAPTRVLDIDRMGGLYLCNDVARIWCIPH